MGCSSPLPPRSVTSNPALWPASWAPCPPFSWVVVSPWVSSSSRSFARATCCPSAWARSHDLQAVGKLLLLRYNSRRLDFDHHIGPEKSAHPHQRNRGRVTE